MEAESEQGRDYPATEVVCPTAQPVESCTGNGELTGGCGGDGRSPHRRTAENLCQGNGAVAVAGVVSAWNRRPK